MIKGENIEAAITYPHNPQKPDKNEKKKMQITQFSSLKKPNSP